MAILSGGCLCGAILYEVNRDPTASATCYCRTCQYIAGGGPSHSMLIHKSDVEITKGEFASYRMKSDEGNRVGLHFCRECGTPLFSESEARPEFFAIKVGSLDDPSVFKSSMDFWVESAQPWHNVSKKPYQKPQHSTIFEKIGRLF